MNRFKRTVALAFLALWLPVSMHCSLETVPGLNFLDWCCDTASETAPADCAQDSCGEIEAGLYRIEDNPSVAPGMAVVLAFAALPHLLTIEAPPTPNVPSPDSSPPGLSQSWQFLSRAALPVRAPSLVS